MPKALDFFSQFFLNKGFALKETPNSKLTKEVFKNMEGLYGSFFYLQKERLQIIELFEGGKEVSYTTLVAEIRKLLKNIEEPNFLYFSFAEKPHYLIWRPDKMLGSRTTGLFFTKPNFC